MYRCDRKYKHYNDFRPRLGWSKVFKHFRWDVLGLYQRDFADLLGISQNGLSRIEGGDYIPSNDVIINFTRLTFLCSSMQEGRKQVKGRRSTGCTKVVCNSSFKKFLINLASRVKDEELSQAMCKLNKGGHVSDDPERDFKAFKRRWKQIKPIT